MEPSEFFLNTSLFMGKLTSWAGTASRSEIFRCGSETGHGIIMGRPSSTSLSLSFFDINTFSPVNCTCKRLSG
jgi:hypothetical protein